MTEGRLTVSQKPALNTRRCAFKDLPLGAQFHNGIREHIGYHAGTFCYEVFEKTSKSIATRRQQHGFGNFRGVGSTKDFAPFTQVFEIV